MSDHVFSREQLDAYQNSPFDLRVAFETWRETGYKVNALSISDAFNAVTFILDMYQLCAYTKTMSIVEIAKKVGVSHATVSRFINRRNGVSKVTADKIKKAISETGYVPRSVHARPGPRVKSNNDIKTGQVMLLHSYVTQGTATSAPASIMLSRGRPDGSSKYRYESAHGE